VASIAAAAAAASSVGVKPQAEASHSAPVAPRNALRRRLRTRARSAPSCCAGTSWPDLRVRVQLLCSARASRRVAKGAGRSMANGEMVGSNAVLRCAWSRPQRGAEARASRGAQKKGRTEDEFKGVRARTLKGCCARLFQGPQDFGERNYEFVSLQACAKCESTTMGPRNPARPTALLTRPPAQADA